MDDNKENEDLPIVLLSSDGQRFTVGRNVAELSGMVKDTIGDVEDDNDDSSNPDGPVEIEVLNVTSEVLTLVVNYLEHYTVEEMTPITTPLASNELSKLVQPWYAKFVEIEREQLFDLVAAANYMNIKPLLDLSCLAVSIMIKGKSAQELRSIFNIQAELTEEERAQIERENAWVAENNPEDAGMANGSNNNNNNDINNEVLPPAAE